MKTKIILFCLFLSLNFNFKAQTYVTIPDANFVTWLQNAYPNCMNGNQMNIDCTEIQSETSVYVNNLGISNLSGIEYFLSLSTLNCDQNQLTLLPSLPSSLIELYCSQNQLTYFADLPNNIATIYCSNNQLSNILNLPSSLANFWCENNQLLSLPSLPNTLNFLICRGNQITNLPLLPNSLFYLDCHGNNLSTLPSLPNLLGILDCSDNEISSLPNLPLSLHGLNCANNLISCFKTFSDSIDVSLSSIAENPFTCLPNYIEGLYGMTDSLNNSFPLCIENDPINNPSGCNPAIGITGTIYIENNSDCILNNSEIQVNNFPLKLYNSSNSLIRQTYSLSNGIYQFPEDAGSYRVSIDTIRKPYTILCQNIDSTIILSTQNPFIDSVNFALICKPGFDVGVQSVLTSGWVFPGQNHLLEIFGGDMSQWYNLECANGISGEVQISISGPVTFQNPSFGSITPVISGNTYTYTVPDFGLGDIFTPYGLILQTDTTAQLGDEICVSINVTPTNGDNNMSNNNYEYCYQVVNSYDPNMKEVYPVNVAPSYDDYFTFTIHFQNTGSAPAFNIRLLDTLDSNLDLETFQVINYSHYNSTMLKNNVLTFHFPNIMLPDSTTNLEGSKGFVQYRIKPKANLPLGTQIKNTANIYFDFNAPIVTNTTVNEFQETNAISEKENKIMNVFPNPFSTSTTIVFKSALKNVDLVLYNVYGQKVKTISDFSGDKLKINRENLSNGIYYLNLESEDKMTETVKLVVAD